MESPKLIDPSGRPVQAPSNGLKRMLRWPGVASWTLLVLGIQALALVLQLCILDRQTTLMGKDASIAETQQELATRPNIVISQLNPSEGVPAQIPGWTIQNEGQYPVRDLRIRLLHFKKFVSLGWQANAAGDSPLLTELAAGQSHPLDLKSMTDLAKQYDIKGFKPEQFADFIVVAIQFRRDIDDKRYLYLVPFQILEGLPKMIRPEFTSISGPLKTSCTMDAYAIELTFEFFRRNPIPYPVEPYNYHYLFGEPSSTCLQSGSSSLRF